MMVGISVNAALLVLAGVASAQQPATWNDDLVNKLAGTWSLQGTVMGRPAHHIVTARWVLGHQFLEVREQTAPEAPATESRYDSLWFLGYDEVSERYVLHLMDVFGARFSEVLGFGTRDGNDLRFIFEYPDGPFRNRWRWIPQSKSWQWHLEQKDKSGKWSVFAEVELMRRGGR
jgi:hypothetical protein